MTSASFTHRRTRLAVATLVCLVPAAVRAQTSLRDPVGAEDLFATALREWKRGNWREACDGFRKSMDLDPSASAMVKIARCHAREGRLATAWYDYQRALKLLGELGYSEQRRAALGAQITEDLVALEPRVPRLRITVTPRPGGLVVLRDGSGLAPSALGEALPVEPGEHEVLARAPGYRDERLRVMVAEGRVTEATLTLTGEQPSLPPSPPPAWRVPDSAPTRVWMPPPRRAVPDRSQRYAALFTGAAGLAALGVAGYYGLRALSLVQDAKDYCDADWVCDQPGLDRLHRASAAETTGLIVAGAGAVVLGIGVALWVTAPKAPGLSAHEPRLEISPRGLRLRGSW